MGRGSVEHSLHESESFLIFQFVKQEPVSVCFLFITHNVSQIFCKSSTSGCLGVVQHGCIESLSSKGTEGYLFLEKLVAQEGKATL